MPSRPERARKDEGFAVAGGGGANGSETAAAEGAGADASGDGARGVGAVPAEPGNPGSIALFVVPPPEGAAAMAVAVVGASDSDGGNGCGGGVVEPENGGVTAWVAIFDSDGGIGCGGGLVEPENGGVTAWVAILPGTVGVPVGVPVAAAIPSGTGGDGDDEGADSGNDDTGGGGGGGGGDGAEATGAGSGTAEVSGGPENGGVTAVIRDDSDEGDSASVTSCSGGWSGAAGSPWKAIGSSEYLLRARSETRPSASSRRCSGVLVTGRSDSLASAGNGASAPGVRSDAAAVPPGLVSSPAVASPPLPGLAA